MNKEEQSQFKILSILVAVFLFCSVYHVPGIFAQQLEELPGIDGTWKTKSGQTFVIEQDGSSITATRTSIPKPNRRAWSIGDWKLRGNFDGKRFLGELHTRHSVTMRRNCSSVWDGTSPIELELSKDGQKLSGKWLQTIRNDRTCEVKRQTWVPIEYQRAECASAEILEKKRYQYGMLDRLRRLDRLMVAIRDNVRPSDLAEKAIDEPGTGYLIREALKLGEELSKELKLAPKWAKSTSERAKIARQAAAAGDLVTRFVNAAARAETSSGSEKIDDLASVLKDARILISVVVSVNPVMTAYLSVLEKAIANVAESARVIEAARAKRNWAIAQAGYTLGGSPKDERQRNEIDAVLNDLHSEIRTLESECRRAAYREVELAERACTSESKRGAGYYSSLTTSIDDLNTSIKEIDAKKDGIEINKALVKDRIVLAYIELRRFEKAGAGRRTIQGQKALIQNLERDLDEIGGVEEFLKEDLTRTQDRLVNERLSKRGELIRFHRCVSDKLRNAKHANSAYLIMSFPQYSR